MNLDASSLYEEEHENGLRLDGAGGGGRDHVRVANVSPEWRLDKVMVFELVFIVVAAAMGNLFEFVPRFIEQLVGFRTAFDGAWLLAMGPQGHQVSHDRPQQFIADLLALGLGTSLVDSRRVLAHRIDGALET
ncbi:MAG: hypothetical protein ABSH38_22105 [Verrucomicrobiota bacterium]